MIGWIDEGREVDAVYIDFSRAFDTVSHNIPLGKLMKCGIDEQCGELRTDWLAELKGLWSVVQNLVGSL